MKDLEGDRFEVTPSADARDVTEGPLVAPPKKVEYSPKTQSLDWHGSKTQSLWDWVFERLGFWASNRF